MNTRFLPRHPRTGVLAVGWRKARTGETGAQPIWPVRGASEEGDPPAGDPPAGEPPAGDSAAGDPPKPPEGDDPPLGPAGEKALAEWKRRAKDAEALSKDQATRLKEFEDAQKSEAEKLADSLKAAQDQAEKATRVAVAAKVEALAAGRFQDPQDAVDALEGGSFIGEDGAVNAEAITEALDGLLERKPHWARAEPGPRAPAPDPAQGARPGSTPTLAQRIAEAEAGGDTRLAMALKTQQLREIKKP